MQAFASQRSSGAIFAASLSHLAFFVLAHADQLARLEIPSCSRGERQGTEFHCLTPSARERFRNIFLQIYRSCVQHLSLFCRTRNETEILFGELASVSNLLLRIEEPGIERGSKVAVKASFYRTCPRMERGEEWGKALRLSRDNGGLQMEAYYSQWICRTQSLRSKPVNFTNVRIFAFDE